MKEKIKKYELNKYENSKCCSYCNTEIINPERWADNIANQLIKIINDTKSESKILKILGFNIEITKEMKIDLLIWRMFAVNLVIQEKTHDQELNNLFHNIVAKKLYRSKKEIKNFFDIVKIRYDEYYYTFNSKSDQKTFNLAMDFLDFFIFGKLGDHKYPKKDKIFTVAMSIMQEFYDFIVFAREQYFKNEKENNYEKK